MIERLTYHDASGAPHAERREQCLPQPYFWLRPTLLGALTPPPRPTPPPSGNEDPADVPEPEEPT
jgi:hypothetical protein